MSVITRRRLSRGPRDNDTKLTGGHGGIRGAADGQDGQIEKLTMKQAGTLMQRRSTMMDEREVCGSRVCG